MLNYLLRRASPLRIVTLMPPEILIFGEDAVLQSLVSAPPDFVALVAKDTSEYGYPPFGSAAHYGQRRCSGFGRTIVRWRLSGRRAT